MNIRHSPDNKRQYFLLESAEGKKRYKKTKTPSSNKKLRIIYKESSRESLFAFLDECIETLATLDAELPPRELGSPYRINRNGDFDFRHNIEVEYERKLFRSNLEQIIVLIRNGWSNAGIYAHEYKTKSTPEHPPIISNTDLKCRYLIRAFFYNAMGKKSANRVMRAHVSHREELVLFIIDELRAWYEGLPRETRDYIISSISVRQL